MAVNNIDTFLKTVERFDLTTHLHTAQGIDIVQLCHCRMVSFDGVGSCFYNLNLIKEYRRLVLSADSMEANVVHSVDIDGENNRMQGWGFVFRADTVNKDFVPSCRHLFPQPLLRHSVSHHDMY